MKLTVKDKDFLERLKRLLEEKELRICLKEDGIKRFVLRQNYGDKVEKSFHMTRQGVRWRFHHLMEMYLAAVDYVPNLFMLRRRAKALGMIGFLPGTAQHNTGTSERFQPLQ